MNSPKPKRSVKKKLLRIITALVAVLLLLAGSVVWWLYGWKLSSAPDFHESWTAEERVALTKFDQYLREELYEVAYREAAQHQDETPAFVRY